MRTLQDLLTLGALGQGRVGVFVCVSVCVRASTREVVCACMCMSACVYVCACVRACSYACACVQARMRLRMCVCVGTCKCACMDTSRLHFRVCVA